ncbi:MAG: hypothetical protein HRF40_00005 [Nitrososphaera sp.]|jgi:hypothetical protein
MSKRHPDHEGSGYGISPHMKGVALSILVVGISLAAIIITWATIGYQGPSFSTNVMQRQQAELRERYGLPPAPQLSPEQLEIPPSLRNLSESGTSIASENSTNGTSGSMRPT